MKGDRLYLTHIQDCIHRIESYTQAGKTAFLQSTLIQDAVARNLGIIGEATKRLSSELRQSYPEIPWRQMAGLRDVLSHDYFKINFERIWNTVEQDLPDLKRQIILILQELEESVL